MKKFIALIVLIFAMNTYAAPEYQTKLGVPDGSKIFYSSGRFVEVDWEGNCILNIANTGNNYTKNSFFCVSYQKLALYAQAKDAVLDFAYIVKDEGRLSLVDFAPQVNGGGSNKNLSDAVKNEKIKYIIGHFYSYDKDNQTCKIGSYNESAKTEMKCDAKDGELLNKEIPRKGYFFGYYASKDNSTLTLEHYLPLDWITNKLQSDYVDKISLQYAKDGFLSNLDKGWCALNTPAISNKSFICNDNIRRKLAQHGTEAPFYYSYFTNELTELVVLYDIYPDKEKMEVAKKIPMKKKAKIFAVEGGADGYCNFTSHEEDFSLLCAELPDGYYATLEYGTVDGQLRLRSATDITMQGTNVEYFNGFESNECIFGYYTRDYWGRKDELESFRLLCTPEQREELQNNISQGELSLSYYTAYDNQEILYDFKEGVRRLASKSFNRARDVDATYISHKGEYCYFNYDYTGKKLPLQVACTKEDAAMLSKSQDITIKYDLTLSYGLPRYNYYFKLLGFATKPSDNTTFISTTALYKGGCEMLTIDNGNISKFTNLPLYCTEEQKKSLDILGVASHVGVVYYKDAFGKNVFQRFTEIPSEEPPIDTNLMYIAGYFAGAKDGKCKINNDDGETTTYTCNMIDKMKMEIKNSIDPEGYIYFSYYPVGETNKIHRVFANENSFYAESYVPDYNEYEGEYDEPVGAILWKLHDEGPYCATLWRESATYDFRCTPEQKEYMMKNRLSLFELHMDDSGELVDIYTLEYMDDAYGVFTEINGGKCTFMTDEDVILKDMICDTEQFLKDIQKPEKDLKFHIYYFYMDDIIYLRSAGDLG